MLIKGFEPKTRCKTRASQGERTYTSRTASMGDPYNSLWPLFLIDASLSPLDEARCLGERLFHHQMIADFFDSLDPLSNLDGALGLCGARSQAT